MTASDITLLRSASDASQSTSSSLVKETGLKKPRTSLTTLDNVGGAFFGFLFIFLLAAGRAPASGAVRGTRRV